MSLHTGEFISYFRNETGMSQKYFAEKFGFAIASIPKWESKSVLPSIDVIKKLFTYCENHKIEIYDYSWNDYIDDVLFGYNYGEQYQRVGDLNKPTMYFVIQCNECGHESAIPLDLIEPRYKRGLCMNCYLQGKTLPLSKYDIDVQEDIGHVNIRHKECGRIYMKNLLELRESGFKCEYCEYKAKHKGFGYFGF